MGLNFQGGDFGFVGQAYTAPDPNQDRQRAVNWYCEYSQDPKSKTPVALLGAPGKNEILDFSITSSDVAIPDTGGVRGIWVLPGGTDALWVVGESVILTQTTVPATQTSIAQFSKTFIGNLLTNSGPVCIRDNGPGGYAVIVDGQYGYTYNLTTNAFAQITDSAFLPADRVAFIDGWLIFNHVGTQTFFTNASVPYTITFSGSFYALKDSSSDNLVTLMENNRELWLVGERTSEVWYDAGGANFAFSRIPGVAPQIGCSAAQSIARLGSSLVWLGKSERGENIVIKTEQYSYVDISTRAVEAAITSYPLVSDAIGFVYEEEGHLFYVLTFPTADKTWVYDHTASEAAGTPQWHERASFNPDTGVLHRDKASCFANYQNIRVVGDFQAQKGYQMSRKYFTDGDTPLVAIRRCPHVWSKENRKRMFFASLQIDFAPGVGLQTGQGSDPQLMVRFSRDGGATFGTEFFLAVGKAGHYKNRAMRRRIGVSRDFVAEARFTDPTPRDIVGATLFAQPEVEAA
jgi:hypothetical protein